MYVRLKHALSALALDAIRGSGRGAARDAAAWLVAFCDITGRQPGQPAAGIPAATVAARLRRRGMRSAAIAAGLRRTVRSGLLEQYDGAVRLPSGFEPYFPYMTRQVHRLAAVLRRLASSPSPRGKVGAVRRGLALLNGGLYFECHEYFEVLWRKAAAGERGFYQGVILIAAGFYHFEKGNLHGARVKLGAGIEKLKEYVTGGIATPPESSP